MSNPIIDEIDTDTDADVDVHDDHPADVSEVPVVPEEDIVPVHDHEDPEIAHELEKVAAPIEEDDGPVKAKPNMVSDDLINRKLTADDLFDKGAI